jgi:hypothetical protein
MEKTKPLVFLAPLSDILVKLKEVIQTEADREGIAIYDVDDLAEMTKLLGQIGTAIILASNPKKGATMLQQCRKQIKSEQSKFILLSPKQIPAKTLDKFMKLGLSECVVEPVALKTLHYKVKLFLRSISTKKEGGEMNSKFGQDAKPDEKDGTQDIKEAKKGSGTESIKTTQATITPEGDPLPTKETKGTQHSAHTEHLSDFYKGEIDQDQLRAELADEIKEKPKAKQPEIDSHYKGNVTPAKIDLSDIATIGKIEKDHLDEDDLIGDLRKKVSLEVEADRSEQEKELLEKTKEEIRQKKKAQLGLGKENLENKKNSAFKEEIKSHYQGTGQVSHIDDSPLKGELKENQSKEEKLSDFERARLEIEKEEQELSSTLDAPEKDELSTPKNKNVSLDLIEEDVPAKRKEKPVDSTEESKKNPKVRLDLEKDDIEHSSNHEKPIKKTSVDAPQKTVALDIEEDKKKYKQSPSISEEESTPKEKTTKLLLQDDPQQEQQTDEFMPSSLEEQADDLLASKHDKKREKTKKSPLSLDLIDDSEQSEKEDQETEALSEKNEKVTLKLEQDDSGEAADSDHHPTLEKKKRDRVLQTENSKKEVSERSKSDHDQKQNDDTMSGDSLVDHISHDTTTSDAKSDRLKTHYSNRNSLRYDEDVRGKKWVRRGAEEQRAKVDEKFLQMGSDDLGEQTIDYGQLKKEFFGTELSPELDKLSPEQDTQSPENDLVIYNEDGTIENVGQSSSGFGSGSEVRDEVSSIDDTIFYEPNPCGLDHLIKMTFSYFSPLATPESIWEQLTSILVKEYQASVSHYPLADQSDYFTEHPLNHTQTPSWASEKEKYRHEWQLERFASWRDPHFKGQEHIYLHPFYEGEAHLGFSALKITGPLDQQKAKSIEALIESARGAYLENYRQKTGKEASYAGKVKKQEKGPLTWLFGKKSA